MLWSTGYGRTTRPASRWRSTSGFVRSGTSRNSSSKTDNSSTASFSSSCSRVARRTGALPLPNRNLMTVNTAQIFSRPIGGRLVPWSQRAARIGCTPLVRVRLRIERRWHSLWLKLEQFNRGGSIKDRTAYGLIEDLEERGLMRGSDSIVESTSGNLGIGLALGCRERGYRFIAVVDPMASEFSIARMRE